MSEDSDDDDAGVGYGKPPKATQWKKGQSGNPSGKKKKEETMRDKLRRVLNEEVLVVQNGAPIAMQQDEALLLAIVRKGINKGDTSAFKAIMGVMEPKGSETASPDPIVMSGAMVAVLERHADWIDIVEQAKAQLATDAGHDMSEGESDHEGN